MAQRVKSQAARASLKVSRLPESRAFRITDVFERYDFVESEEEPLEPLQPNVKLLIFLGMGVGVALKRISRHAKKFPELEYLVIEKDPNLFRSALENEDFSDLIASGKVSFMVGESEQDLKNSLRNFFGSHQRVSYINAIQVFAHPFLALRHDTYYRFVEKTSNEVLDFGWNAYGNSCEDSFIGLKNFIENIQTIAKLPRLKYLKGSFEKVPAIICASGPSLEMAFELLKDCENRALIFAADSALKPLLDHGIRPHIVTAIERDAIVPEFFRDYRDLSDIHLALCPVVLKEVYDLYRGPQFAVYREFDYFKILVDSDETHPIGPTCANMAFTTARMMGCSPIILVGQDLSHDPSTLRSHTRGTIFPERERSNKLEDLLAQGYFYIEGNSHQVLTHALLDHALKFYEREIAESGAECINTSLRGAKIAGTSVKKLEDCFSRELKEADLNIREKLFASMKKASANMKIGDFKLELAKQHTWLQKLIFQNQIQIDRLESAYRKGEAQTFIHSFLEAQKQAMTLVNETPEFSVLLRSVVAPFIMKRELESNQKASELGTGVDFCKWAVPSYRDFYRELNLWAEKILRLLDQTISPC